MKFVTVISAMVCLLVLSATVIAQESTLNTPEAQCEQGMQALAEKDYDAALQAFERARQMNSDYAPAYVGIGLIHSANGDPAQALKALDTALRRDGNSYDARMARGHVYVRHKPSKNWRKDAVNEYERALKIRRDDPEARYQIAHAWHLDGEFDKAERLYRDLMKESGPWSAKADQQRRMLDKIKVLKPVSKYGRDLLLSDAVTRAELAVLLVEELDLVNLVKKRDRNRPTPRAFQPPDEYLRDAKQTGPGAAADVLGHWARGWIALMMDHAVMEAFADGGFRPDEPVNRAHFAMALQNVYILVMDQPELARQYLGRRSMFTDVPGDHYAYNAIALCVSLGFLQADRLNGAFGLENPVAGADVLYTLHDMRRIMEAALQ